MLRETEPLAHFSGPFYETYQYHSKGERMNINKVEGEITSSPKRLARIAGLLYLIVGIFGGFAVGYVTPMLYVPGDAATTAGNMATFIPLAIVNLIAASMVYGELLLITNSIWPAVLLHTIGNALVDVLIVQGFVRILPGTDFLVSPGHRSLLTMSLFALIGWYCIKHGYESSRLVDDMKVLSHAAVAKHPRSSNYIHIHFRMIQY
jgi:hypothetical protein